MIIKGFLTLLFAAFPIPVIIAEFLYWSLAYISTWIKAAIVTNIMIIKYLPDLVGL